jgi:hypothetical protein
MMRFRGPPQRPECDITTVLEAHPLVELCGTDVFVAHVEERDSATLQGVVRKQRRQPARVAVAREIRMGADRADFLEIVRAEAFAGHRRQAAVLVDPKIAAQRHGALTEVVRVDQGRERQHVVAVLVGQLDDGRPVDDPKRRCAGHLRKWPKRRRLPTFRYLRRNPEQVDALVHADQFFERVSDIHATICDAEKRGELGRVTLRLTAGDRDRPVARLQRQPERIVEFGIAHRSSFRIEPAQGGVPASALCIRVTGVDKLQECPFHLPVLILQPRSIFSTDTP